MKKVVITVLLIFVLTLDLKKKDMTLRQTLLRAAYPLLVVKEKVFGGCKSVLENRQMIKPLASFYALRAKTVKGEEMLFEKFRGRKVLVVNTASNCGYTAQYEELQKLYNHQQNELIILAFPANDFKQQEKGTDNEIEQFCKINFGVTFPLMQKSVVVRGDQQNAVFAWLTNKALNGWNDQLPEWNFSKYLIDEQGVLTHYFAPAISPLGTEVKRAL